MELRLAHLYPRLMNIYGDRGNIMVLRQRCRERGVDFTLTELTIGDRFDPDAYDLVFIGGAQDREQRWVADDLRTVKGAALRSAVENGVALLAVCGGYQLLGKFYRAASGDELPGMGLLDLWTIHPGEKVPRSIGNVVCEWDGGTLVGFENHGGRTYLGPGLRPLARVRVGGGNNGSDGGEGVQHGNVWGTYLHGPLLPKNPALADHVIAAALSRRNGTVGLAPLDDALENRAHQAALRLRR